MDKIQHPKPPQIAQHAVIDLDTLGKVRASVSSVARQVQLKRATENARRGESPGEVARGHVMLARNDLLNPVNHFDQRDKNASYRKTPSRTKSQTVNSAINDNVVPSCVPTETVETDACFVSQHVAGLSRDVKSPAIRKRKLSSLDERGMHNLDSSTGLSTSHSLKRNTKRQRTPISRAQMGATDVSRISLPRQVGLIDGEGSSSKFQPQRFLPNDDDEIAAAEAELIMKLDDQILEEEFKEISNRTWQMLAEAVLKYKRPGGFAQNVVNLLEETTPGQINLGLDFDFHDLVANCPAIPLYTHEVPRKGTQMGPFDVRFLGNGELRVIKELPKYVGDTEELLLTEKEVSTNLVPKLSCGELTGEIRIDDKKGDPYTIVVEIRGEQDYIDRAKKHLQRFVKTKQMRFVSLERNPRTSTPNRSATKRKIELFNRFSSKYEKIRGIDFGGIHAKSFMSSVWRKHKEKFGHACNPCCRCPLDLAFLTSSVVDDMVKKGKGVGRPPEIGFCTRFAPKFMGLLREEFPRETNESLLNRMIRMWQLHLKQQRFGTSCPQNCPCLEGWTTVFLKGRLDEPVVHRRTPSSEVAPPTGPAISLQSQITSQRKISEQKLEEYELEFNTKSPLGFFVVTKVVNGRNVCSIFSVSPTLKDVRLSPGTTVVALAMGRSGSDWHHVSTYEDLKSSYYRFRRHPEGQWMRIRFINTDVKPVGGPKLSKLWTSNSAWQGSSKVKGWAGGAAETNSKGSNNSFPQTSSAANAVSNSLESADTQLRDTNPHVVETITTKMQDTKEKLLSKIQESDASSAVATPLTGVTIDGTSSSSLPSEHTLGKSPREPGHHILQKPRSILRERATFRDKQPLEQSRSVFRNLAKSVKRNKPVLLSWAPDAQLEDLVLFDRTASAAAGFELCPHRRALAHSEKTFSHHTISSSGGPSNDELLAAIAHQTCSDVFKLLREGADTNPVNVNQKEWPEAFAKSIRDKVREKMLQNRSKEMEAQLNDIVAKVNLLKILNRARNLLARSACLTKWAKYEARVDRVEQLNLTDTTPLSTGDKLFCEIKVEGEIVGERLLADWSDQVQWPESKGKRYKFFYNESLPDRYRPGEKTLELSLGKTIGNIQRTIVLSSKSLQLDEIKSAVTATDTTTLTIEMPQTENLKSGRTVLSVRKLRDETKVKIEKERKKWRAELQQVVNEIKQFNNDPSRESAGMHQLDFNLQLPEPPHTSLLHAAVLFNDFGMVSDLISCGADRDLRNDKGVSPKTLALTMLEMFSKGQGRETEMNNSRKILEVLGVSDDSETSVGVVSSKSDDDDELDEGSTASGKPEEEERLPLPLGDLSLVPLGDGVTMIDDSDAVIAMLPDRQKNSLVSARVDEERLDDGKTFSDLSKESLTTSSIGILSQPLMVPHAAGKGNVKIQDKDWLPSIQQAGHREMTEVHRDVLPSVFITDLIPKIAVCRFFQSGTCKFGRKCLNIHLYAIDANELTTMVHHPRYESSCLLLKEAEDCHGEQCFTALFWDRSENVYLKVVGGNTLGANRGGLYWYRSSDEAKEAMNRVIAHWQQLVKVR